MARLDRLADAAALLRRAVLTGTATTPARLRQAICAGEATGQDPVDAFAATVREHAFRVTDAQVAALRDAGLSDDAIFEITVAAALGAAERRLDAGLAALGRQR